MAKRLEQCPLTGEWQEVRAAWYVWPLGKLGNFGQFILDVKLGLDTGDDFRRSLKWAWRTYGWAYGKST
jgi:hypothetical protein